MKKYSHIVLLLSFLVFQAAAQDLLVQRDSVRFYKKITEIGTDKICFTLPTAGSGKVECLDKDKVAYIVFQNGYVQRFEIKKVDSKTSTTASRRFVLRDSALFYKFDECVSINYLNFINRELGFIYQRDFFEKHFNIVVPVTIGLDKPVLTHSLYFRNNFTYTVDNKLFDLGLGINYIPSYRSNWNFILGPVFRAMFYNGQQILYPETGVPLIVQNSTLTRMSLSLTSGVVVRTRSRLQLSAFVSLGACHDFVANQIRRPTDNKRINPITDPNNFYIWTGFNMGFSF